MGEFLAIFFMLDDLSFIAHFGLLRHMIKLQRGRMGRGQYCT